MSLRSQKTVRGRSGTWVGIQVTKHTFGKFTLRFHATVMKRIKKATLSVKLTLAHTSPSVEVIST